MEWLAKPAACLTEEGVVLAEFANSEFVFLAEDAHYRKVKTDFQFDCDSPLRKGYVGCEADRRSRAGTKWSPE